MLHGKFLKIEPGHSIDQSLHILKALASEQRLRVLAFVGSRRCTVTEIARGLNLPLSTTTAHVNILQDAGLLHTEIEAASRGLQKVCNRTYDQLLIDLSPREEPAIRSVVVALPIGHYSRCAVLPTCGLASLSGLIGLLDDPMAFYEPERMEAQLLWFRSGYVEYLFPTRLPPHCVPAALQVSAEICSEAPLHNLDWPSDITVWINDVEIGTWTSPADFGGQRGHLTPDWWDVKDTQYGLLKRWQVTDGGTFIDGLPLSAVRVADLGLDPRAPIRVRLGVKSDARHVGGLNLFGSKFGNYPQDLTLRVDYQELPTPNGSSAPRDDVAVAAAGYLEEVKQD